VEVQCYSGHTYATEPRRVAWRGTELEVASIVRAWRTPAGPRFLVGTAGGRAFELDYDELQDVWWLEERPRPA
jgi:hypothetical protein